MEKTEPRVAESPVISEEHQSVRALPTTLQRAAAFDGDTITRESEPMSIDAYSFSWNSILTKAAMHRLVPAKPGPTSICIDQDVFDCLLAIAEAAARANTSGADIAELRATRSDDGSYVATRESSAIGTASGTGRTLLEAIDSANHAFERKVEDRIK